MVRGFDKRDNCGYTATRKGVKMERSACQGHVCAVLEQRDGQPVLRITNQWDRLQANSITQVVFDGTALDDLCDVLLKLKAEMAPAEEQSVREYVDERDQDDRQLDFVLFLDALPADQRAVPLALSRPLAADHEHLARIAHHHQLRDPGRYRDEDE